MFNTYEYEVDARRIFGKAPDDAYSGIKSEYDRTDRCNLNMAVGLSTESRVTGL